MAKKILVIDDEEILTRTFRKLLEKQSYEVSIATQGWEALEKINAGDFDLIVSDIRMPGTNGVDVYKEMIEIWNRKGKAKTPVIFLTGFADEKLERIAQGLSPLAYWYKPFDAFQLLDLIKKNLSPSS